MGERKIVITNKEMGLKIGTRNKEQGRQNRLVGFGNTKGDGEGTKTKRREGEKDKQESKQVEGEKRKLGSCGVVFQIGKERGP